MALDRGNTSLGSNPPNKNKEEETNISCACCECFQCGGDGGRRQNRNKVDGSVITFMKQCGQEIVVETFLASWECTVSQQDRKTTI